jgi:hypothetical protein
MSFGTIREKRFPGVERVPPQAAVPPVAAHWKPESLVLSQGLALFRKHIGYGMNQAIA